LWRWGSRWCFFAVSSQVPRTTLPSVKFDRHLLMTPHDLGQLALLLSPAMLLSVLLLFTFAAGG